MIDYLVAEPPAMIEGSAPLCPVDPAARIITHDTGEEWRALREMAPPRALTWDEALAWLRGRADP